jgi:hypothetical protein
MAKEKQKNSGNSILRGGLVALLAAASVLPGCGKSDNPKYTQEQKQRIEATERVKVDVYLEFKKGMDEIIGKYNEDIKYNMEEIVIGGRAFSLPSENNLKDISVRRFCSDLEKYFSDCKEKYTSYKEFEELEKLSSELSEVSDRQLDCIKTFVRVEDMTPFKREGAEYAMDYTKKFDEMVKKINILLERRGFKLEAELYAGDNDKHKIGPEYKQKVVVVSRNLFLEVKCTNPEMFH